MLKKIDILSPRVNLYFNNSTKLSNAFGGLLTVTLVIIAIIIFIIFGMDLIYKENPTVISTFKFNNSSERNLTDFDFMLGISGILQIQIPDVDRRFDVFGVYYNLEEAGNYTTEIVPFIPCRSSKLYQKNTTKQILDADQQSAFYCLPDNFNETFSGVTSDVRFKTLDISVT